MELQITGREDEDRRLRVLVEETRRGNATAFAELVDRVSGRIRGWALRITGDPDDADDVAQLVLLRLHRHADAFEGRSRVTSWLFRITRNIALAQRMQARRRAALLDAHAASEPGTAAAAHDDTPLDASALARLVRAFRTGLSPRQRSVFELADLQGVPLPEIARRLGIAPVTVRVLLSRARRTIRLRMLEEHPGLLEDYAP